MITSTQKALSLTYHDPPFGLVPRIQIRGILEFSTLVSLDRDMVNARCKQAMSRSGFAMITFRSVIGRHHLTFKISMYQVCRCSQPSRML